MAEDGDAVDILVLIEEPTFSGCMILARPIGMLRMRDEKGSDNKVLGVPIHDPRWRHLKDIHDAPPHLLNEIENFFLTYKRLEAKVVSSEGCEDSQNTKEYLDKSVVQIQSGGLVILFSPARSRPHLTRRLIPLCCNSLSLPGCHLHQRNLRLILTGRSAPPPSGSMRIIFIPGRSS